MKYLHLNEFKNYFAIAWGFAAIYFLTGVTEQIQLYHDVREVSPRGPFNFKLQVLVARDSVEIEIAKQYIFGNNGTLQDSALFAKIKEAQDSVSTKSLALEGIEEKLPPFAESVNLLVNGNIKQNGKEFLLSTTLNPGINLFVIRVNAYGEDIKSKIVFSEPKDTLIVTKVLARDVRFIRTLIEIPQRQKRRCDLGEFNERTECPSCLYEDGYIRAGEELGDFELVGFNAEGERQIAPFRVVENFPPSKRGSRTTPATSVTIIPYRETSEGVVTITVKNIVWDPEDNINDVTDGVVYMQFPVHLPQGLKLLGGRNEPSTWAGWYEITDALKLTFEGPPHKDADNRFTLTFRDAEGYSSSMHFEYDSQ